MESASLCELSDLLLNRLAGAGAALAHDHRLLPLERDEIVVLAPQLVGDHGRLRPNRGHDADAASFFLCGLDEAAKIAVAGKDHDVIHGLSQFHHVDGELDIHVALYAPPALAVRKFLEGLGDDLETIVVEPIYER